MLDGQTGIRLREALWAGDPVGAAAELGALDEAHRVELLLGAALRDGRDGFAAARLYLRAAAEGAGSPLWAELLARLAGQEGDASLDVQAAGLVAARRAPDRWRPEGEPWSGGPRPGLAAVLDALARGVSGLALVDAYAGHDPLHPAVEHYYRRGSIHALGPRPLLCLALRAGS